MNSTFKHLRKPLLKRNQNYQCSFDVQQVDFDLNFIDEEEFCIENPLEGLQFPAPADVQPILKRLIPQIITDYQKVEYHREPAAVLLTTPNAIKFDNEKAAAAVCDWKRRTSVENTFESKK